MEPLIENLVIFGIVGAIRTTQWLYSTHEERINREVEHIRMYLKRCGDKMKGLKGFDLSFEEVLGDVSTANKCLESDGLRNLLDDKKFRLRVTPVFRGNGNVFVKLLKYNSAFAYAFGNMEFDFEVVKRRKDKEEKEEEKREWEKREEGGFTTTTWMETKSLNTCTSSADVRLRRFIAWSFPALRQISEKYENRENEETRRLLEVEDVTTTRTDRGVTGEECSICLDASLEVIARCGHGFCQECYARWLRRSGTCALCRERLPTTDHGGAFSLVSFSAISTEVPLSASFSQTNHRGDAEDEEEEPEEETLENFQICFGNEASLEWLKHRLSTFDVVCEQDQQQQHTMKKLFSDPIVQLEFISDEDVILTCTSEPRVPSIVKALQSAKPFLPFQFVPKTSTNNDRNCAFWMFPREVAGKVQSVLYEKNVLPPREKSCNRGEIPATTLKVFGRTTTGEGEEHHHPGYEDELARNFEVGLSRIPKETLEKMYKFQIEGVKYGLSRGGRVMIADQMGVGKTLQAIALMCCYEVKEGPVLIVAPASMRTVWANELERWIPDIGPEDVVVVEGSTAKWDLEALGEAYKKNEREGREYKGKRKIAVSSYHMLSNLRTSFLNINWGEAAYTAIATQLLKTRSRRAILCTGTPSLVKPFDIFNQLDSLRPNMFGTKQEFGVNYCRLVLAQASRSGNKFWKSLGGRRLNELHTLLKHAVMIRRLKCEVMDQLPPKRRQVIYLDISSEFTHWMKEHAKKFALLRKQLDVGEGGDDEREHRYVVSDEDDEDEEPIVVSQRNTFEEIDEEKDDLNIVTDTDGEAQAIGKLKVKKAVKFLEESILIDKSQQVVVFGHHHSVLDEIYAGLQEVLSPEEIVCVDGRTDAVERRERVDKFYGGKSQGFEEDGKTPSPAKVRVAVFGITLAVGIDLSSASTVCFVELPQKPADLLQAEDRAWRRERNGKNSKTCVNIYYCIAKAEGCAFDTDRWQRLGRKIEQNTMMTDGSDDRDGRENLDCDEHGSQVMLEAPQVLFSETEQQQQHEHLETEATQVCGLTQTQTHPTPHESGIKSLVKRKRSLETKIRKKSFFTEPERVPIWFVVSEHTDRVHLHDMRLLPNETRLNCSVKQVDVFVAWDKLTKFLERYRRGQEEDEVRDVTCKTMSPALREKTRELLRNFVLPDALIDDCDALNCCKFFIEEWNCLLSRDKNIVIQSRTPVQCGGVAQLLRDLTIKKEEESTLIKTKKQKSTTRHGTGIKLGTLPKDAVSRTVLVRKSNFGFEAREQFIILHSGDEESTMQLQVLCDCCCKPYAFNDDVKLKKKKMVLADGSNSQQQEQHPLSLHDLFCSKDCFEYHVQSRSGKTLRMAVFERDRGVCEKCKLDCHALVSRIKCLKPHQRLPIIESLAPQFTRAQTDKLARDAYEGSAWEADHILAVKDGGGECTVDNMRTLCRRCHAQNTKEQHKRWAWENKAKKDKNQRTLLEVLANRIVKGDGTSGRRLTSIKDDDDNNDVKINTKKSRAKDTPSNSASSFPISEDSEEDDPVSKSFRKNHLSAIRDIDNLVSNCEKDDFNVQLDDDTDVDDIVLPLASSQEEDEDEFENAAPWRKRRRHAKDDDPLRLRILKQLEDTQEDSPSAW
ncbi:unnamed protein product [Bathycoccus prasinos]